uniref:Uncharacterized protein n=1 Tax=Percolomonas cosmopolitus TaxID=63605 RepID=A0A7S1PIA5_9EUKA
MPDQIDPFLTEYARREGGGEVVEMLKKHSIQYEDIPNLIPQYLITAGMKIHDAMSVCAFLKEKYRIHSEERSLEMDADDKKYVAEMLQRATNENIVRWVFHTSESNLELVLRTPNSDLQEWLKKPESQIESFKKSLLSELDRRRARKVVELSLANQRKSLDTDSVHY